MQSSIGWLNLNIGTGIRWIYGAALRILIIDDSSELSANLRNILEERGYEVEMADNGYDGLALVSAGHPQLMLLDLIMPGLDGYQTLLAAKDIEPGLRVITMSASARQNMIKRVLASGAEAHLSKPIDVEQLISLIDELVYKPVNEINLSLADGGSLPRGNIE